MDDCARAPWGALSAGGGSRFRRRKWFRWRNGLAVTRINAGAESFLRRRFRGRRREMGMGQRSAEFMGEIECV